MVGGSHLLEVHLGIVACGHFGFGAVDSLLVDDRGSLLVVAGIPSFAVEQLQKFAEENLGRVLEGSPFLVEGN